MGNQGFCLSKSEVGEDHTFSIVKQVNNNVYNAEEEEEGGLGNVEIIEAVQVNIVVDPVPIQSALRGHFLRKKINQSLDGYKKQKPFKVEDHFEIINKQLDEIEDSGVKDAENNLSLFEVIPPEDDTTKILIKPAVKLENGSVYQGGWDEKGNRHGAGTLITENGAKIVGYFKDNKIEGKGRSIDPNGLVYQGDFKEGKFEGEGKFLRKSGAKFEGSLKNGKLNGGGNEE